MDTPVVAIVPARGGSKRIPRKNIRPFRGVPLLERTISILRDARVFDRIVVSTDDDDIATVATGSGAEVPFLRPAALAGDHTGTREVVVHAIRALEAEMDGQLGPTCLAYATGVFIRPIEVREALDTFLQESPEFVFTATPYAAPVQRALRRLPDGTCEMLWPEHRETRSQDLEPTFHDAGQFYWGARTAWLEGGSVLTSRSLLHVIPHWRVQDIDTEEDWTRAELLHRMLDDE